MTRIYPAGKKDMDFIKRLYAAAFPAAERKPFSLIRRQVRRGLMELLVIADAEQPVGFAVTARAGEVVLIDYLAISDSCRSRGYGSAALRLLTGRYAGCALFLEVEASDNRAENQAQRIARKAFYLRNGFVETGEQIRLFGVEMELLSYPDALRFADCLPLYRRLYGRFYARRLQLLE